VQLNPTAVPIGLEVFLVPRRLAAVLVHGTLDASGFPVPVGILSVDPGVVERAHGTADEIMPQHSRVTARRTRRTWGDRGGHIRHAGPGGVTDRCTKRPDTVGEVTGAEPLRENLVAAWRQTGR
jgi:hypothetical protein